MAVLLERGWFKKAAEQGHAGAQYRFGQVSFLAHDSSDEVGLWFRRSAAQGYADACYHMYSWRVYAVLDKCREEGIVDFDEKVKIQNEDEECREWKRKYELAYAKKPYTASDKVLIKWLAKLAMQGREAVCGGRCGMNAFPRFASGEALLHPDAKQARLRLETRLTFQSSRMLATRERR